MFGTFLFLTYYLQIVKGYSPISTGFAFLPLVVGMVTGSAQIGTRLVTRLAPRLLMGPAFLVAASGLFLLTQLETGSSYLLLVLPGMLLLGLGIGTAFMPAMALSAQGVAPRDAGVASAMVNTSQQVGGAIGTALLNTIAASATASYLTDHLAGANGRSQQLVQTQAMVHGYTDAIWCAVAILVLAAVIAVTFINAERPGPTTAAGSGEAVQDGPTVPVIAH
jgi:predicted MFS family arabinose efflux permease